TVAGAIDIAIRPVFQAEHGTVAILAQMQAIEMAGEAQRAPPRWPAAAGNRFAVKVFSGPQTRGRVERGKTAGDTLGDAFGAAKAAVSAHDKNIHRGFSIGGLLNKGCANCSRAAPRRCQ